MAFFLRLLVGVLLHESMACWFCTTFEQRQGGLKRQRSAARREGRAGRLSTWLLRLKIPLMTMMAMMAMMAMDPATLIGCIRISAWASSGSGLEAAVENVLAGNRCTVDTANETSHFWLQGHRFHNRLAYGTHMSRYSSSSEFFPG
jgi:hypothetical protein